ncbi:MAG TPA: hypothetical protein VFB21_01820 [Chthonomonadaceae bacterium]|nr:hypothetical protein [Chthonomonadaceae bacterium]
MRHILSPSQRVASSLRRVEKALRDWQDDPDSPRADVNKMLATVGDLRLWVQGHVLADIERVERQIRERGTNSAPPPQPPATDRLIRE